MRLSQISRIGLALFLFLSGLTPALFARTPHAPENLLFTPTYRIDENPYYEWVTLQAERGTSIEQAKIEYLIERIRVSPYQFIRNDVEYDSSKAAGHLAWKYGLGKSHAKTALDFIHHLAMRSLKTGLLYLVKLPDGNKFPVGELLENELRYLESHLTAR